MLPAAVSVDEQVVAAADEDGTQSPFGRRAINVDGAVVALTPQRWPKFERVQDRRRRVEFARERVKRGAQPAFRSVPFH